MSRSKLPKMTPSAVPKFLATVSAALHLYRIGRLGFSSFFSNTICRFRSPLRLDRCSITYISGFGIAANFAPRTPLLNRSCHQMYA